VLSRPFWLSLLTLVANGRLRPLYQINAQP
jgi:hypothetical protein